MDITEQESRNTKLTQGWRYSLVSKVFAWQTWEPKFSFQNMEPCARESETGLSHTLSQMR